MADDEEIVTFRLGPRDRAAIQRLVDEGEFRNRSDFLRHAVKNALREHDGSARRVHLDLELEGYDLPATAAGRRTRPSRRKGGNTL